MAFGYDGNGITPRAGALFDGIDELNERPGYERIAMISGRWRASWLSASQC